MWWTDWRGNKVTRDVNHVIDVRDFIGTPGYSMLVVAANTNLSVADLARFLELQSRDAPGVARGRNWIQRRRWLFQQPNTANAKGAAANSDGNAHRALKIMRDNATLSVKGLSRLLKEHGITRSPEWCRRNRVTATTT